MSNHNVDGAASIGGSGCSVVHTWIDRVVVVAISGDLDMATAPQVAEALGSAAREEPAVLIVDLSRVRFLASAGINLLISVHQNLLPSLRFGVVADGPGTSRPLEVIGVDSIFAVYRSLDEALDDSA